MKIDMLEFLMENSVHITSEITGFLMIADEMYELGGEFVVYKSTLPLPVDLYRGKDFNKAMKVLGGSKKD